MKKIEEVTIKTIVFISDMGFRIKERPLDHHINRYGALECYNGQSERQQYDYFGNEYSLIKNSQKLENYNGLLYDYETDLEILRTLFSYEVSVSAYEAIKYVLENRTDEWSQSPYSKSFYSSQDIDWDYKPEGSLRVSDHWNFGVNGEHCPTHDKTFKNGWAVGRFENGAYNIIKVF
ncbi:hypothetical protein JXA27_06510 [Aerococcaceae bacterium zg-B36]|uniref:hypothetical protein n=1 Tax=Aerococcaceae bacterium zg-252 TaxID=2796928 RepID=UPI001BD8C813|nr:hypothetical protein [Aerococcaceae bacterium zg-B36]